MARKNGDFDIRGLITRNWLWGLSLVVMIASSGLDGRYVRSWMYDGWLGALCGYGLNFAIDVGSEILSYEYIRHRQDVREGRERDRRRRLSALLLLGQFGLIYFGVVFSWRQLSLVLPGEPSWLLWSGAAFSQFALVFLGIAQALRDGKAEVTRATMEAPTGFREVPGSFARVSKRDAEVPGRALEVPQVPCKFREVPGSSTSALELSGSSARVPKGGAEIPGTSTDAMQVPGSSRKGVGSSTDAMEVPGSSREPGGSSAHARLSARQIRLLAEFPGNLDASFAELGELLEVSRTTARKDVQALVRAGKVRESGNGHRWEVVESDSL